MAEREGGFFLIEALLGILLLAFLLISIGQSAIASLVSREQSVRQSAANQIAVDTLEQLKCINPSTLGDSYDIEESASESSKYVLRASVRYTRLIDVTEHADGSRTLSVEVRGPNERLGGRAAFNATVIPWGSQ